MATSPSKILSHPLPVRPNLEHLRKLAKAFLKAVRSKEPTAMARWRSALPAKKAGGKPSLSDAQQVIAKEHGFSSWPKMKDEVERINSESGKVYVSEPVQQVESLYADVLAGDFRQLSIAEQLERQARRALAAHLAGNTAIVPQVCCWLPGCARMKPAEIMALPMSLSKARLMIAREYGFKDWKTAARKKEPVDEGFEAAVDVLLAGQVATLKRMLKARPELARMRSAYGHRATLLHYLAANGIETYRQRTPLNAAAIAKVLLAAGAEVNATADMYGGGCTALHLLITSAHPWEAGVCEEVAAVLRAAGATREQNEKAR